MEKYTDHGPWSVYKSAKSFLSLSILLIAQLRYQILIFLEMKLKITLVVARRFQKLKNEKLEWNRNR